MCDPSFQDCRAILLAHIRDERVGIDVAMWFMEDDGLADAIIARHGEGLRVRALVDPRRNPTTPKNAVILERFAQAGIPMRYKLADGILHWKFMIFNSQNTVQFSAANYGDYYFKPATPYLDYTDEGIYFCDDPPIVDSFRRKFDDSWVDTTAFASYANVPGAPARLYPLYPIDPSLSFVPAENFAKRSIPLYDAEPEAIDVIMYKITEGSHADGLIRASKRGVPVRLITEPERYRNPDNVWHAYQVDRLYMAGVAIRHRAHDGFLHQKSTLLYGQRLTIFGSSNWTSESNKSQYEHNYFTAKAWFFDWFRDNFDRKWTNRTGHAETTPFVPLPPDVPVYAAPANGATGLPATGVSLSWKPGPWAHRADVYFGTSASPPLVAANVGISPSGTRTYALPALSPGVRYYWKIVSRTMAAQGAAGPVYSFVTAGDAEPPPPPPPPPPDEGGAAEIVLHASAAAVIKGNWRLEPDATAAGGQRLWNPDAGAAKRTTALASPADYAEFTFAADAGRPYRLWLRGRAEGDRWSNDSVHVQFSGSVNAAGAPVFRIGSTASTEYNLESCSGCGLSGWGWEDNGWGAGVLGPVIYFASTGAQTIRVQTREDGLSIDQVVLSAGTYLSSAPGAARNDSRILAPSPGDTPPPPPPPPPAGDEEIILYAADAARMSGNWRLQADSTAAGGQRLWNPDAGAAKRTTALASPADYAEFTFTAEAGRAYRLWIRGRAERDKWANDSVHIQFSGSVNASGAAVFRIGSTASTEYNLESCSGCGLSGWGWEDNGWGTGVLGPVIYFAAAGPQTIRLQTREDGLSLDQIVLSPVAYLGASPGAARNDTTILDR
jgi:hypothetical protein